MFIYDVRYVLSDDIMPKRVSLVMPIGMWENINIVATVDDMLPSEVIRDAIREYIEGLDWKHYFEQMAELVEEEDFDEDEEEEEYVEEDEEE